MTTPVKPGARVALELNDTWRVFRVMSELVEGFERMAEVGPAGYNQILTRFLVTELHHPYVLDLSQSEYL